MSKTQDLVLLVDRLIERTRQGVMQWTKGVRPAEYNASSGVYKFVLAKDIFGNGFRLQVMSADGVTIEDYRSDQNPFSSGTVNALMPRPKIEQLWSIVSDSSSELKKVIQSI